MTRGAGVVAAAVLAFAAAGCGGAHHATAPSTETVPASDSSPTWSPDGQWIAYAHSAGTVEAPGLAGIYVGDDRGGIPSHVLAGPYAYPSWSPDGSRIAVTSTRLDGIYTMTPAGDSLTKVSSAPAYAVKWSPDGRQFTYETYDDARVYRLWTADADGTNARCLNPAGSDSWFEPEWSPDGARLAHVRLGGDVAPPALFVMDTTALGVLRLTDDGFEARYPAWSPDGQWIAWGSWHGGHAELWIMSADGSFAQRLCDGYWPSWASDSRRIAFTTSESWNGTFRVFTVDRVTLETREVSH